MRPNSLSRSRSIGHQWWQRVPQTFLDYHRNFVLLKAAW